MATIRHINKEEYAAKALDLLNARRDFYVLTGMNYLSLGFSPEKAREEVESKVCRRMEDDLFEYLKSRGIVCGDVRYLYDAYGYCRRYRHRPSKHDVPTNLLDIREVLPNYAEVITGIMVDAKKLKIVREIESITQEAQNDHDESSL